MIGRLLNFRSFDEVTSYNINDRGLRPLLWQEAPFYYIATKSIDGLFGADVSYEAHPIPHDIGEKSGDVFRKGRTITISGTIEAMSLGYLEAGAEFLQEMFADTRIRKLTWSRWKDGIEVYIRCRVNQDLSIVTTVEQGRYEWAWTVGLRADDPRTYKTADDSLYPTWQQ